MGTFSIVAYILAQLFQKEPDTMMQAFFARGFSIAGKSGGGGSSGGGGQSPAQMIHTTGAATAIAAKNNIVPLSRAMASTWRY